jgi:hypothetical protein
MAGEWVIGGCEAKVFAWACVLGGLGEFLRGRPASAWLAMGCGAALHPIVGGWGMIALVPAWWLTRTRPVCRDRRLGGGTSRRCAVFQIVAGPRRLGPMLLELAPTPSPTRLGRVA